MRPDLPSGLPISRRSMLRNCSTGFGLVALNSLLGETVNAQSLLLTDGAKRPHFTPKAKHVIFCYMSGGVSHVDSFDPKPRLEKEAGQPMPMPIERTQFNQNGKIQPSHWPFHRHGESGIAVSELFPHMASVVDELAIVRSMTADFSEHAQGNYFMHTGFPFMGHPSAGAWASYGLGSDAKDLPSFVVLRSGNAAIPHGGTGLFSSGFLPANHQASIIRADHGEALRNLVPAESDRSQRARLDFIQRMDRDFATSTDSNPHIEAAIENYELAYRMQTAVPEFTDLRGETKATKKLYGMLDADRRMADYGRQCLLARRLVERGVRFIELSTLSANIGGGNGANPWDQHSQLKQGHGAMAHQVDQPIAALILDLKRRGLLDDTLVVWAGEFGRTPFAQGSDGRDHNPLGFTIWLAGGGVRPGMVYGATDEYGYHAVQDKCTVYDLWATVLHQLGIRHMDLTYRYGGRDLRLTDVHGHVLHKILK
ncbi:MAG: hypothetical protein ACI8UD_000006 [Planctomycetota bacterium]|jgi:hypothetical protein